LFSRLTGPSLSPFNAWVLSKSLETLAIRLDAKTPESSGVLENHPQVNKVKYPFEIASSI
jgi:O-succinylhomoserine sulfhydrylase